MLFKLVRQLLNKSAAKQEQPRIQDLIDKGRRLWVGGDFREAVVVYRECLELDPKHVETINNLGVCLSNLGDEAAASVQFELAYTLDDTYLPSILNYARSLIDRRRSEEALPLIRQGFCREMDNPGLSLTFSSICLAYGDSKNALRHQLKSWLGDFDSLRTANAQMFKSTYADISEEQMAAEHLFWAETCRPCILKDDDLELAPERGDFSKRKIRIGYWSPDFRNHSVRYFFRPLLEGHNRDRFEIFLYHDNHAGDVQTDLIKKAADHFHDVYLLNDQDLYELMKSHQLDVLVELAGHTSANRLPMLQNRLATLQLTGIGYPPTTGMATVDAKFLDPYIVTPDASKYYAEAPMVLKDSFWCFDPMEDAPITETIPVDRNGYITFCCAGNLAKINPRILRCWSDILSKVPNSRLMIRSISLEDEGALGNFRKFLVDASFPMDRVELLKPAVGIEYLGSYNDVDIVLDTYPFNGGTTSCAATYMGVPIVTLYGKSLVTRMGLSIMSNLDAAHLAVNSEDSYVKVAVELAADINFLRSFRRDARKKYRATSLGNGQLFAKSFENACLEMLERKTSGNWRHVNAIEPLPEGEIVRRAYKVFARGNFDAVDRIVAHCLKHYPNSGGVRVFEAQKLAAQQGVQAAYLYLKDKVGELDGENRIAALFSLAHWANEMQKAEEFAAYVGMLEQMNVTDSCDLAQVNLFKASLQVEASVDTSKAPPNNTSGGGCRFHVVVPCDDLERFESMRENLMSLAAANAGVRLSVDRCSERNRVAGYEKALRNGQTDVLVLLQKTVDVVDTFFFNRLLEGLDGVDAVSSGGAQKWDQPIWRLVKFEIKAAGFIMPSDADDRYSIQLLGSGRQTVVEGMAVLDGNILAVRPSVFADLALDFDDDLVGGDFLLEEDWIHRAYRAGAKLAVHRNLGVVIKSDLTLDARDFVPARVRMFEKHELDPFGDSSEDQTFASFLVADAKEALRVSSAYFL